MRWLVLVLVLAGCSFEDPGTSVFLTGKTDVSFDVPEEQEGSSDEGSSSEQDVSSDDMSFDVPEEQDGSSDDMSSEQDGSSDASSEEHDMGDGGHDMPEDMPCGDGSILIEGTCSPDLDGDMVADGVDNCPSLPNPDQSDIDGDGIGDECSYGFEACEQVALASWEQIDVALLIHSGMPDIAIFKTALDNLADTYAPHVRFSVYGYDGNATCDVNTEYLPLGNHSETALKSSWQNMSGSTPLPCTNSNTCGEGQECLHGYCGGSGNVFSQAIHNFRMGDFMTDPSDPLSATRKKVVIAIGSSSANELVDNCETGGFPVYAPNEASELLNRGIRTYAITYNVGPDWMYDRATLDGGGTHYKVTTQADIENAVLDIFQRMHKPANCSMETGLSGTSPMHVSINGMDVSSHLACMTNSTLQINVATPPFQGPDCTTIHTTVWEPGKTPVVVTMGCLQGVVNGCL